MSSQNKFDAQDPICNPSLSTRRSPTSKDASALISVSPSFYLRALRYGYGAPPGQFE
jgi:hypothetical protein